MEPTDATGYKMRKVATCCFRRVVCQHEKQGRHRQPHLVHRPLVQKPKPEGSNQASYITGKRYLCVDWMDVVKVVKLRACVMKFIKRAEETSPLPLRILFLLVLMDPYLEGQLERDVVKRNYFELFCHVSKRGRMRGKFVRDFHILRLIFSQHRHLFTSSLLDLNRFLRYNK